MGTELDPDEVASRVDDDNVPNERLLHHAEAVGRRASRLATGAVDEQATEVDRFECIGLLHDVGKAAPAFQAYIRGNRRQDKYTYHARLGAFATAHALAARGASDRDILAGWAAVLKHHGSLPNLVEEMTRTIRAEWRDDNGAWAEAQVESIHEHGQSRVVFDRLLKRATAGATGWEAFREAMGSRSIYQTLLNALDIRANGPPLVGVDDAGCVPAETYDRTLRLWSALTFADKTTAGEIEQAALRPSTLDRSPLEDHVDKVLSDTGVGDEDIRTAFSGETRPNDESSLNALREAGRRRVRQNAPDLLDREVGLLTLPTGLGKTFSGITGAFTLRDAIQETQGRDTPPLVVYALPYTSIIEQTREIFETEVFDADSRGQAFTTHHYLAETVTYTDGETGPSGEPNVDRAESRAKLLGESWRSGVVLTTFVQLFESLAGPSNAAGLKLPALHDAVIVLDEPQALPKPWWGAVRRLSRMLIDEFDARIISMTATQPTLFTEGPFETCSLLSGADEHSEIHQRAYRSVSRVRYRVDDSVRALLEGESATAVPHEIAADRLIETAFEPEQSSVLSVCSTVASSRTLTELVSDRAPLFGRQVRHIGAVYQSVLDDLDTDPTDSHPSVETLATATLQRLGAHFDDGEIQRFDDDESLFLGTFNARYRPLDRRVLIEVADTLSTLDVPFVFVSTQAIEAGVDISFADVFRDIAPLDSVVQTAGRCNRSFEWGVDGGTATVWALAAVDDADSTLPAQYIYPEAGHLNRIAELLCDVDAETDGESIPSATLELDTVREYFEFVEERGFVDTDLHASIDACEADRLGRRSLIGDEYETVDVLVAATDADDERLVDLQDRFSDFEGAGYERLAELNDMRVSISVREIDELSLHTRADGSDRQSSGVDVFLHPVDHGNGAYDLDCGGFVVTEDTVVNRFT